MNLSSLRSHCDYDDYCYFTLVGNGMLQQRYATSHVRCSQVKKRQILETDVGTERKGGLQSSEVGSLFFMVSIIQ